MISDLLAILVSQSPVPDPGIDWVDATKTLGLPTVLVFLTLFGFARGWFVPGFIYTRAVERAEKAEAAKEALEAKVRDDIVPLVVNSNNQSNEIIRTIADIRVRLDTPPRRKSPGG